MLVQFSVKNYKVFKEKQTFSMVASSKYKKQDDTHTTTTKGHKLLNGAVLYGANASGKSALVEAMMFFKAFINESSRESLANQRISIKPFQLSTVTESEPSEFEIIFIHQAIQYRYGFEVDQTNVIAEWLYIKDEREVEHFYRDKDGYELNTSKFKIGKMLTDQDMVRPNALLLSVAAQFNDPTAKKINSWLDFFLAMSGLDSEMYGLFTSVSSKVQKGYKEKVLNFLQRADLGISDFLIETSKTKSVADWHKKLADEVDTPEFASAYDVKTLHRKYDENNTPLKGFAVFDMEEDESKGTQKYFQLIATLITALNRGAVLIIDELDARLHTKLVSSIIELFHNPKINTKNAQLIITTHNTNLLNEETYRRDQIWFVKKDRYGASTLYSLNSFKSTSTAKENYEKKYLEGRYGAIPYIQTIDHLLSTMEE